MTEALEADIHQLVIADGHRLVFLAVFGADSDDPASAIYEYPLDASEDTSAESLLDANTWVTSVLPQEGASLVFGTVDGEVVVAIDDDDIDAVEASEHTISALAEVDGAIVVCTVGGEVLAIAEGEVTPWKTEGPALLAITHVDGITWVAGEDGYLARREGEDWKALDTGTKESLHAIAQTAGGVVVVGRSGAIVQVQGDRAVLRTEGDESFGGVAIWRGATVLAAGSEGLLELTQDGTKVLRAGRCEGVAADSKYLVISSGSELLVTQDGVVWKPVAYDPPEPHEEHEHDENCDHEH